MKLIHYVEKVTDINMYGLVSLVIFFVFFTGMLIWVFKTKKQDFNEISRIPLDEQL